MAVTRTAVAHGAKDGENAGRGSPRLSSAARTVAGERGAAGVREPQAPEAHRRRADMQPPGDLVDGQSLGGEQDDAASNDQPMRQRSRARPLDELRPLGVGERRAPGAKRLPAS